VSCRVGLEIDILTKKKERTSPVASGEEWLYYLAPEESVLSLCGQRHFNFTREIQIE
jgi:hypothetical protein